MPQLPTTPSTSLRAKSPRRLLALSLLIAAIGLPACATDHFDQSWKEASTPITQDVLGSVAGKWEGRWNSNGFDYENGLCRAIITPDNVSDDAAGAIGTHYRVDIKLFYFNLLPRDFSFIMTAAPLRDEKITLIGEKDFGAFTDGVWKFEGDVEGRDLYLSYTSTKDYGTLSLHRVPPPQP